MQDDEKIECLMSLKKVSEKEIKDGEDGKICAYYRKLLQYVSEKIMNLKGKDSRLGIDRKINQGELKEAFNSISVTSSYLVDNPEDNKKLLTLLATQFLDNSHLFFQKFQFEELYRN